MSNILALIHTGELKDNELVVASVKAYGVLINDLNDDHIYIKLTKEINNWLYVDGKPTEAFQTSKDLKQLESQFREKGYVVHLHEKRIEFCRTCLGASPYHVSGCPRTQFEENKKKPLMLAVFAPEDIVRELV